MAAATTINSVCQACGDIGFIDALVVCWRCKDSAEHRYCLASSGKIPSEKLQWSCERCEQLDSQRLNAGENLKRFASTNILIGENFNSQDQYSSGNCRIDAFILKTKMHIDNSSKNIGGAKSVESLSMKPKKVLGAKARYPQIDKHFENFQFLKLKNVIEEDTVENKKAKASDLHGQESSSLSFKASDFQEPEKVNNKDDVNIPTGSLVTFKLNSLDIDISSELQTRHIVANDARKKKETLLTEAVHKRDVSFKAADTDDILVNNDPFLDKTLHSVPGDGSVNKSDAANDKDYKTSFKQLQDGHNLESFGSHRAKRENHSQPGITMGMNKSANDNGTIAGTIAVKRKRRNLILPDEEIWDECSTSVGSRQDYSSEVDAGGNTSKIGMLFPLNDGGSNETSKSQDGRTPCDVFNTNKAIMVGRTHSHTGPRVVRVYETYDGKKELHIFEPLNNVCFGSSRVVTTPGSESDFVVSDNGEKEALNTKTLSSECDNRSNSNSYDMGGNPVNIVLQNCKEQTFPTLPCRKNDPKLDLPPAKEVSDNKQIVSNLRSFDFVSKDKIEVAPNQVLEVHEGQHPANAVDMGDSSLNIVSQNCKTQSFTAVPCLENDPKLACHKNDPKLDLPPAEGVSNSKQIISLPPAKGASHCKQIVSNQQSYDAVGKDKIEVVPSQVLEVHECQHPANAVVFGPLILPIYNPTWRGCFAVEREGHRMRCDSVKAHVSDGACGKVHSVARMLPHTLNFKMSPRLNSWPKTFKDLSPTPHDIALFFFPDSDSLAYEKLLKEAIERDSAMKAILKDVELLVFPSLQLPVEYHRYEHKFYLWGIFRRKQDTMSVTTIRKDGARRGCETFLREPNDPFTQIIRPKEVMTMLVNTDNHTSNSNMPMKTPSNKDDVESQNEGPLLHAEQVKLDELCEEPGNRKNDYNIIRDAKKGVPGILLSEGCMAPAKKETTADAQAKMEIEAWLQLQQTESDKPKKADELPLASCEQENTSAIDSNCRNLQHKDLVDDHIAQPENKLKTLESLHQSEQSINVSFFRSAKHAEVKPDAAELAMQLQPTESDKPKKAEELPLVIRNQENAFAMDSNCRNLQEKDLVDDHRAQLENKLKTLESHHHSEQSIDVSLSRSAKHPEVKPDAAELDNMSPQRKYQKMEVDCGSQSPLSELDEFQTVAESMLPPASPRESDRTNKELCDRVAQLEDEMESLRCREESTLASLAHLMKHVKMHRDDAKDTEMQSEFDDPRFHSPSFQGILADFSALCKKTDPDGFWGLLFLKWDSTESLLREKLPKILLLCVDPGRFVLDVLSHAFPPCKQAESDASELPCLLLLDCLLAAFTSSSTPGVLPPDVATYENKGLARGMANKWKRFALKKFWKMGDPIPPLAHTFLRLVSAFDVVKECEKGLYTGFVLGLAWKGGIPALALQLGLDGNELVPMLLDRGSSLQALFFVYEFGLANVFPPEDLMREHLANVDLMLPFKLLKRLNFMLEFARLFGFGVRGFPIESMSQQFQELQLQLHKGTLANTGAVTKIKKLRGEILENLEKLEEKQLALPSAPITLFMDRTPRTTAPKVTGKMKKKFVKPGRGTGWQLPNDINRERIPQLGSRKHKKTGHDSTAKSSCQDLWIEEDRLTSANATVGRIQPAARTPRGRPIHRKRQHFKGKKRSVACKDNRHVPFECDDHRETAAHKRSPTWASEGYGEANGAVTHDGWGDSEAADLDDRGKWPHPAWVCDRDPQPSPSRRFKRKFVGRDGSHHLDFSRSSSMPPSNFYRSPSPPACRPPRVFHRSPPQSTMPLREFYRCSSLPWLPSPPLIHVPRSPPRGLGPVPPPPKRLRMDDRDYHHQRSRSPPSSYEDEPMKSFTYG